MAEHLPRCIELARVCYNHPDPAICAVASENCWYGVVSLYDGESGAGGRNRFDSESKPRANTYWSETLIFIVTAPCELDDICYPQAAMLEKYLNTDLVWDALRVSSAVQNYSMFSAAVATAFTLTNV